MKYLLSIIITFLCICQNAIANSQWEIYNTYKDYSQLVEYHGKFYIRSGNAVYYTGIDEDIQTASFTRLDGLYSSTIQQIAKCEEADHLVVVHSDGVIDILNSSEEVSSIYDLKNKSISGDKTINNITVCNKSLFVACGFGFIEIDLEKQIIKNAIYTPSDCEFAFAYGDGIYYSLSSGGLWRCDNTKNLTNNENWKQIEELGLRDVIVFNHNGKEECWIIDEEKDIHILNPDGSYKRTSRRKCYEHLKVSGNYVFSKGWGFDIIKIDNQEISYVQQSPYSACREYYALNDSVIFAIHPQNGIMELSVKFQKSNHAIIEQISESNKYFEIAGYQINELAYSNGVLAGTSGYKMYAKGYTEMCITYANVNFFKDGEWSHISEQDVLSQPLASKEFRGLTDIIADPLNKDRFYVSTLTTGIYQFDSDSLTKHLLPTTRISSICCDENGSLWVPRLFSDTALWSYNTITDKWTPHKIDNFVQQNYIGRIVRQENEPHQLIWLMNGYPHQQGKIAIVYNPTNPDDNSKDQTAVISSFKDQDGNIIALNSNINYIYDLREDKEGKIWILTNIGPFVIDDVVSTFNYAQKNSGIGTVTRIKVPRNDGTNLADYLLSNINCTAMVADKYNRKWIGTMGNGIYLISSDGLREIEHFTTDNSPLHSNDITALAYDEEGQRLFIACDGGLVVYHTNDIEPANDYSSFYCYPNPIHPDYYGEIEIVGLMENSQVSITDATGILVWRTLCLDGKTSWDGRDNNGEKVAPGVYMVHGINKDSSKGEIFKLLVL